MRAAITIPLDRCKKHADLGIELKEKELNKIVRYLGGRNDVLYDWYDFLLLCKDTYGPRYAHHVCLLLGKARSGFIRKRG